MTESPRPPHGATELRIATEPMLQAQPTAPWLRVSWVWIWVNGKHRETLLTCILTCPLSSSFVLALFHSCFHVPPREGSCSWVQPREGSCHPIQPREGSCFHILLRERLGSQVQPCRSPVSRAPHAGGHNLVCVGSAHQRWKAHKCPPIRLLLPPPPLSSGSPSARPQPTICTERALWVCHPPLSPWLENPLPPSPASKTRTPPRPIDPATPPLLLAPSSMPWPISPLAPPGFHVHLDLPWSVVDNPAPRDSTPPAAPRPSGSVRLLLPYSSTLVLCCSGSTAAFWIPRLCIGRLSHLLCLGPMDPPWGPCSSALHLCLWLLHHLLCHIGQPFLLHGSSLHRLHHGLSSWLWPGSHLAAPAPSPSCCLPGSFLSLIHPVSSWFPPWGGQYVPPMDCQCVCPPPPQCAPIDLVSPLFNESFRSPVFPQLPCSVPCHLSPVFPVSYVWCLSSLGALCVSCLPCDLDY